MDEWGDDGCSMDVDDDDGCSKGNDDGNNDVCSNNGTDDSWLIINDDDGVKIFSFSMIGSICSYKSSWGEDWTFTL